MTEENTPEKDKNHDGNCFHITTLGVVFNTKTRKILIGRRENDSFTKELTQSFPGGFPDPDIDLEKGLEVEIKKKTGLDVKNLGSVFSRIFKENKDFILIYYLCEVIGGEEKSGASFKELKWINPDELDKYFTTSINSRLMEYIMNLK